MNYARMYQQYKYDLEVWNRNGNIGDCIQNLAVENLYNELGVSELILVNRDDLASYQDKEVLLPMQGWFGNSNNTFLPDWSDKIHPVFFGFHLSNGCKCREIFLEKNIHEKIKEYQPIGCRDRNTCEFFKTLGVDSYFSACMTLTFPRREKAPQNGKVFIVDLTEEAEKIIPEKINKIADRTITHSYTYKKYPVEKEEAIEFENKARKILKRYRDEAKLVITSRIHVAMPCTAMGIPVIFIHENVKNERFDVINGIINKYSPNEAGLINWSPKPKNIEKLKKAIKENVYFRIWQNAQKYNLHINRKYSFKDEIKIRRNLEKITNKYQKMCFLKQSLISLLSFSWLKNPTVEEKLFLFRLMTMFNKRIVFWGASIFLEEFIKKYKLKNKNIVGIIDKNPEKLGKFIGDYEIFSPEKLENLNPDAIVLSIKNSQARRKSEVEQFIKENLKREINIITV